ncbi:ISL3 family transposase [Streptomyces sanglieri]|uniref:ISL3 family transposase n=1 Tax=Streptomyces sanglieri TaxID=193460 RepID=A0ABW2WPH9_9ACTN
MQTDAPFWDSLVFDGIDEVDIEAVKAVFGMVEVVARGRAAGAACPDCGRFSGRVHDRYQHRLRDLPLAEQGFVIRLTVRRFICGSADCPRRTFTQPFSRLAAPHARFTTRLNHTLERVGLALAGRAGARLAAQLGLGAGRMTLLRRVMALPDPRFSTPRVLGVDDFAIRRGQTYSTVLTSVEDHRVVDVLPTREAGPLAAWLVRHPGVEVICRDRAGAYAYAEGSRRGAPDALQVADRFHLWQGLGRAVETCVAAHRDCLRSPSPSGMLSEATRLASGRPQDVPEPVGRRADRKKAAHALVHEILAQGHSRRAIARHLGWGLNTVLRYANAPGWQDTIRKNRPRPSRLDPYKPYLERRFAEGCTGVTRPHSELVAEHLRHGPRLHRDLARGSVRGAAPAADGAAGDRLAHPTPHDLGRGRPGRSEGGPGPMPRTGHCRQTRPRLRRDPHRPPRLHTPHLDRRSRASRLPGLTGFAVHLRRDLDAVTAGLTLDWSSGSIEGAVNRIKRIKRQLYGRAGFELLRKMILLQYHPETPPRSARKPRGRKICCGVRADRGSIQVPSRGRMAPC